MQCCTRTLRHLLRAVGTDRRSGLPRQQGQVSKENRTRHRGTWEVAATAGFDPLRTFRTQCTRISERHVKLIV